MTGTAWYASTGSTSENRGDAEVCWLSLIDRMTFSNALSCRE